MSDNIYKTRPSDPCPGSAFFIASWKSLEEGLTLMAGTPERERLVPETVSALRKAQAAGDPPSKLLLRVLAATAFLSDDSPIRSERGEVGVMS